MFCLADLEAHAGTVLDKNAWDYYSYGAGQKQTMRDNKDAFKRYRLRPRMLRSRDVSKVDTAVQILGTEIAFPVCVSPMALQCMAHPDGEAATATACTKMNTCMVLSSLSTMNIEEVAESSGNGLRWLQLYLFKDKALVTKLIVRAESAGYKALVITVDHPALQGGKVFHHFRVPKHLSIANFVCTKETLPSMLDPSHTWETIDWLQGITKLPIIIKGILTFEDAQEALKHNVRGIIVSNHGGRQLDGVPATIDALPEVVDAVKGRVEIFLDGGVREGTDVLKALALGAKAVFVGRPALWGLAFKGSEGVELVLKMLKDEFRLAMMLSGCMKLSDIKPELIVHQSCIKPHTSML